MTKQIGQELSQKENILCSVLDELALIKATDLSEHESIFKTALNQLKDYTETVQFTNNGVTFPKELQAGCRVKVAKELLQLASIGHMETTAAAAIIEDYISLALGKIQELLEK